MNTEAEKFCKYSAAKIYFCWLSGIGPENGVGSFGQAYSKDRISVNALTGRICRSRLPGTYQTLDLIARIRVRGSVFVFVRNSRSLSRARSEDSASPLRSFEQPVKT